MIVRCDRMSLSKARCRKEGSQAGAPFFYVQEVKIAGFYEDSMPPASRRRGGGDVLMFHFHSQNTIQNAVFILSSF